MREFDYTSEMQALDILWDAYRKATTSPGFMLLSNAVRYLEKTRPSDWSKFIRMGAN